MAFPPPGKQTDVASGFPGPTQPVSQAIQQMFAQLEGYLRTDHQPDGTHKDVRALSCSSASGYREFARDVTMAVANLMEWSPALFTAAGGGVGYGWVVPQAGMNNVRYALFGNLLWYGGQLNSSNVTGPGAPAELRIQLPLNLVAVGYGWASIAYQNAGGARAFGEAIAGAGLAYLSFQRPGATWTLTGGGNTLVDFNVTIPVQSA